MAKKGKSSAYTTENVKVMGKSLKMLVKCYS